MVRTTKKRKRSNGMLSKTPKRRKAISTKSKPRISRPRAVSKPAQRKRAAFRQGNIGSGGGKGLIPLTRTYNCVVADQLLSSITTAGDMCFFDLGNYSNPGTLIGNVSFSIGGTASNHPSGHDDAISLGYTRSMVKSCVYDFFVRNMAQERTFVFGYKFVTVATASTPAWTAGTVTIDNLKDIRQSRGWVLRTFSSVVGGNPKNTSSGLVRVSVPHYFRLAKSMLKAAAQDLVFNDFQAVISTGTNIPTNRIHLAIFVADVDGVALGAGDIVIDTTIWKRITLSKPLVAADYVDEATQVV